MKVSSNFEIRGGEILFGGSGSLIGPAGSIGPQCGPSRSRPGSGAYARPDVRQAPLPPKPLPMNPAYRNTYYQSLSDRVQAETAPEYAETRSRPASGLSSGRSVQSRDAAPQSRDTASHYREKASRGRDTACDTGYQPRESSSRDPPRDYGTGSSQNALRELQREIQAAQREFERSQREANAISRDREATQATAAELCPEVVQKVPPRTPENRTATRESRGAEMRREREPRAAETRAASNNTRMHSLDRSTRSVTSRAQGGSSAADRLNAQRRSSAVASRQDPVMDDECAEYSDRFLAGYDRGRLLGKGACAVVWLAQPTGQKGYVAVKQVAKGTTGKKRSDTESARKEIFFGSYFFHPGGEHKLSPSRHPGVHHIAKLLDYSETKRDVWMVMEYGGTCLTKMAYEIKGEFLRGERLYRVVHLPLLQAMKRDPEVLKGMLRQLLSALCVLADHHIVHSDIKPDNILVEEDEHHQLRARFIDLGSAFTFDCPENLALATPEYMPPEALETCVARSGGSQRMSMVSRPGVSSASSRKPVDPVAKLHKNSQPWSFDIWSLGSILLELCLGTPLWLSYKCRVADDQRANSAATGLFAVPGRDPDKIVTKQCDALRQRGLPNVLRNAQGIPINNIDDGSGLELLSLMLAWDPSERISPHEALEHPWLQEGDF